MKSSESKLLLDNISAARIRKFTCCHSAKNEKCRSMCQVLLAALVLFYIAGSAYEMYVTRQELGYLKSEVHNLMNLRRKDTKPLVEVNRENRSRVKRTTYSDSVSVEQYMKILHWAQSPNDNEKQKTESMIASITSGRRPSYLVESGTSFVWWGKSRCPSSTKFIYGGYAGGAYAFNGLGGSTELECLPSPLPQSGNFLTSYTNARVMNATFYLGNHSDIFKPSVENMVVACAVCMAKPTIMIPGSVTCPPMWMEIYTGYIMSTLDMSSQRYSKNYCVHHQPDALFKGTNETQGLKLTFVQASHCSNDDIECSSYFHLPCVVCSHILYSEYMEH